MKDLRMTNKQKTITLAALFSVAGIVYALISLVNHYLFKTYSLDLGLYTHFMYEYAHFRMPDLFMLDRAPAPALSDHFDLYLVLLSPLVYVFGSWTLLIVQIAAGLLGGWGVYRLISLYTEDDWLPILATAMLFFSFGVIQPFAFDYHSNVLSAMILPWLLYYVKKRKFGVASLFVVLFVIGKENMSLWLFFIVTGLMWDYRKDRKTLWHLVAYSVFSVAYFLIVNMVLMPKLGGSGGGFARYAHLGDSYLDIAKNLLAHPLESVGLLSANTMGYPQYDGIKEEFYYCILASGAILILLKPNYLWMLIPLVGQKMLAVDPMFWGISFQYSVEFMPVLVVTSFVVILKLRHGVFRVVLASALLISTILTTFYTLNVPKAYVHVDHIRIYQGWHYRQIQFDTHFARRLINEIPEDAYVCAASMFVPHLALRDYVEDFVWCKDTGADYVLITEPYFNCQRKGEPVFGNRDEFEVLETDGTVYLLKRKPS